MANTLHTLHLQYITNEAGEKTAVILPIDEYQELLEDIEDPRRSRRSTQRADGVP